ncbi:response regulator transcription factor [Romboutsia sp.]|uniref:response regulator transcription factor n=1 Tax=Romboutsia sp. TaxID=1965302 RepID=UPI003F31F716
MIILLADDEKLVRLGLKNMIEELEPHTHKFLEARNGKELIKVFNQTKPDLAFVDINMPLMDGLSAIEHCSELSTNTRWFILTGEKEFHLAKKAISLGVKDYLLKPISLEELRPIIFSTKTSKKEYLIQDNYSFELNIISTYNKLFANKVMSNKSNNNYNNYLYTPYLFSIDGINNIDDISARRDEILNVIREFMVDKLDDNLRFAIHYIDSDNLLLLVRSTCKVNIDFSTLLTSLQGNNYSISLSQFYPYSNELQFYQVLDKLKEYTFVRVLENFKGLLFIDENFSQIKKDYLLFSNYIYKLSQAYLNKEELLYNEYVSKISQSLIIKNIYTNLEKTSLENFFNVTIDFNFDYSNSFSAFTNALSQYGSTIFEKNNKSSNDSLVDEIIKYIKANYMNEIGVNTIACLYNITPNYLSKIFHEKAGVKFIDYITSIRIKESKKLLTTSSLSVREIAEKVGYNSASHFSKQFIKAESMTPSDFIRLNNTK